MPIKLYKLTIFISSDRTTKDSEDKRLSIFGDVYYNKTFLEIS